MRVKHETTTAELAKVATRIRRHVVTMSAAARAPHVASALSCVDILVALYFRSASVFPDRPGAPDRDRVLLSKGHGCAALYACLAERAFFPHSRLAEYAQDGSTMAEHPAHTQLPGVEITSGSLGHGLGVGSGMALALKMDGIDAEVFVVLSDGECNEGSVWEAALWAPAQQLDNVTAIVDFNKLQATGDSTKITSLAPLAEKWRAFGWDAVEVDGHDLRELVSALEAPRGGKPRAVIAHTVKGKGVSFMENDLEWHYRPPSEADLQRALAELGAEPV